MRTVVTGAAGFLGRAVARRLRSGRAPDDALVLVDRVEIAPDDGVETLVGDLSDPDLLRTALSDADRVIHLAALPGGAAEADYEASRRVNLEASLALAETLAQASRPVRLVYASSIAVFGAPLPARIDDDTLPRPSMTYGAHKLMVETALANLARLGRLDAVALRLPGLVARPRAPSGLKSAFMSDVFHALAAGESMELPVGPDATMWVLSVDAAAGAMTHAAELPSPPPNSPRALTLPALRVTMGELVAAISAKTEADPALVRYAPDAAVEAMFGRLPPLETPTALALGFRHDGDLAALVERVLRDLKDHP